MEVAVILIVIIIVLSMLTLTRKQTPSDRLVKYQYTSKKQIMSNAEKIFYDKLLAKLGDEYYIVPQAHLSMFLNHKIKGQNWKGAFSTINGKSVDFLIVEKITQKPALAIELDDYTHLRSERLKRDAIVKEILDTAGIPLQRYLNNSETPTFEILKQVSNIENKVEH